VSGGDGRREAAEEEGGYRTKNKNPTRQCGEIEPNYYKNWNPYP